MSAKKGKDLLSNPYSTRKGRTRKLQEGEQNVMWWGRSTAAGNETSASYKYKQRESQMEKIRGKERKKERQSKRDKEKKGPLKIETHTSANGRRRL